MFIQKMRVVLQLVNLLSSQHLTFGYRMSPKASPNMEVVREGERRKVDEMMELGEEMEDIQEEGREEEEASDHGECQLHLLVPWGLIVNQALTIPTT